MYKNLLLDWALSRMIPHDHQLEGFQVVSWLTFLKDLLSNKISFLYYFSNSLFFLFFLFSHQTWVHTYSTSNQNCAAWCLRSVSWCINWTFEKSPRVEHSKRNSMSTQRQEISALTWIFWRLKTIFQQLCGQTESTIWAQNWLVTIAWLWRHALRDTGDEWIDKPTWIR